MGKFKAYARIWVYVFFAITRLISMKLHDKNTFTLSEPKESRIMYFFSYFGFRACCGEKMDVTSTLVPTDLGRPTGPNFIRKSWGPAWSVIYGVLHNPASCILKSRY